jgi:2,3-bisphosphoglycerate-independent phosphoglycerate mutase
MNVPPPGSCLSKPDGRQISIPLQINRPSLTPEELLVNMRVLFIFLDGVGLGVDDPEINPFAEIKMPVLQSLLGGNRLLAASAPYEGRRATLLALDASLGVRGLPQSATGQAVLLTGINVPAEIGEHYGPKPNPAVAKFLIEGNLFSELTRGRQKTALLNAYPPRYFQGVDSGKRLYSAIPMAVTTAGLPLFTKDDFFAGRALSADFTGAGWAGMLGFPDAPVLSPHNAGNRLAELASGYDFSLFEYWASDYAGHKQDMKWAIEQFVIFDAVLGGLLENWKDEEGLILITSDHGNMEDLSTRRHTNAKVPALLIGSSAARASFSSGLEDLTGIHNKILQVTTAKSE